MAASLPAVTVYLPGADLLSDAAAISTQLQSALARLIAGGGTPTQDLAPLLQ